MLIRSELANRSQVITLNWPEKRNALHPDLISDLAATLQVTEADDQVRVVILTGAGSSFCAGLDLKHMVNLDTDARVEYMRAAFALFRQVYELRQPVIAAVNGPAMAGGFDLAAFCDLRICSRVATFAQTEILLGLTQIIYPVYKILGLSRAKELALTGTPISAEEAYRIGFVSEVHGEEELLDAARMLAAKLEARPPEALFETKRLARDLIGMDFATAFDRMYDAITTRLRSEEHRAAVQHYLDELHARRRTSPDQAL
jgi:enoyl-CoA hydratase/carnithine racemase